MTSQQIVSDATSGSVPGYIDLSKGKYIPTWASQDGFYVHQQANHVAMLNVGGSNQALIEKALDDATNWADKKEHQNGFWSFIHAMSNDTHGDKNGYDRAGAMEFADSWVRSAFKIGREELAKGNIYAAYFSFGIALHTLQDATSPAHAVFSPWHDNEGYLWSAIHAYHELFYPGVNSNLQQVTDKYLQLFRSNKDLPRENLFLAIQHD